MVTCFLRRGSVSIGLIGSTEPINFKKRILEHIHSFSSHEQNFNNLRSLAVWQKLKSFEKLWYNSSFANYIGAPVTLIELKLDIIEKETGYLCGKDTKLAQGQETIDMLWKKFCKKTKVYCPQNLSIVKVGWSALVTSFYCCLFILLLSLKIRIDILMKICNVHAISVYKKHCKISTSTVS